MPLDQEKSISRDFRKHVPPVLFTAAALLMLYPPMRNLFRFSSHEEYYSHILLIPFVSAFLLYAKRRSILSSAVRSVKPGVALVLAGLVLYGIACLQNGAVNPYDQSTLLIFAVLLFWLGSFILFYGIRNFQETLFPLLFLGFMIPWPSAVMDGLIGFLQIVTTELVNILFTITDVTFIREGLVFHLPGISIEVARECCGIRSCLALLITGSLAACLFLGSPWRRLLLIFSIFPLVILKNGIRILTLSLLAVHVDERIVTESPLHKFSGVISFIPTLLLLGMLLWILMRQEQTRPVNGINGQTEASL